jgi:predicted ATP-dependent serine protease
MKAREVETLADTLERCWPEARTMWALGVTMRAPAGFIQSRDHGLAIVAVLMAALRRASLPKNTIILGDISLDGRTVPVSDEAWQAAEQAAEAGELSDSTRIVAPAIPRGGATPLGCKLIFVKNIEDLGRLVEATDE